MTDSVAIHDHYMNITYRVVNETQFECDCGWQGLATELVVFKDFTCCPICLNFDVRVKNHG